MATFIFAVLALGVAGLDPLGALIVAGALAAGATRTGVWGFTAAATVTTVVVGTALSLLLEPLIDWLGGTGFTVPDNLWLIIELVLIILLLAWGVRRIGRSKPRETPTKEPKRGVTTPVLLGAAVVFALSALTDPTYYAVIVLAGRGEPLWLVITAHLLWFMVSQSPLLALSVTTVTGGHDRLAQVLRKLWDRGRPLLNRLLTTAIFLAVTVLSIDVGFYLFSGDFLIG